jgi:glutamyl-tRNA reductase
MGLTERGLRDAIRGAGVVDVEAMTEVAVGVEACRRLMRVAGGLESQIVGEPHILGQARSAYGWAAARGAVGPMLHALCRGAICCGRRIRSETGINPSARSFASLAVSYAVEHAGLLASRCVLVVGSGKLASDVCAALAGARARRVIVVGRNAERAGRVADQIGAECRGMARLAESIGEADVTIVCTASRERVVLESDARLASPGHLMMDLSVPRNVTEGVGRMAGVRLASLDDLTSGHPARREAVLSAEGIVEEELGRYLRWLGARRARRWVAAVEGLAA